MSLSKPQAIEALKRMDMLGLKVRDGLVLWLIVSRPGMTGADIAAYLGLKTRSLVQYNLIRLQDKGLIEDARTGIRQGVPTQITATNKGRILWNEISGQDVPLDL